MFSFCIKSVKTGLFLSKENNWPHAPINSDKWSTKDKRIIKYPSPSLAFERVKKCSKTSRAKVVLFDGMSYYNISKEKT